MRTTIPSCLHLFRQCLLLGFLLTPVMAVGQAPDFAETLRQASQGDGLVTRLAQYNLGVMYANGDGVPQNYSEAMKWYRRAADQGDPDAQYNLGLMYASGDGVPSNYVTAYAWVDIAVASENSSADLHLAAREVRSDLEERMTPSQIAEAQQLSTEIFERIQGNQ